MPDHSNRAIEAVFRDDCLFDQVDYLMPSVINQPIAVISGGSSGIGLECARLLCARGYRVTLLARDELRLESAKASILATTGCEVAVRRLDVIDSQACAQAIAEIAAQAGRIDWLITSAGIAEPGLFAALKLESHRSQMETNYFGTLNLVIPTARAMGHGGGGRITLISSGAAFIGIAGYSAYAPGKFAVRALGEILRVELAPQRISVSVAFPSDTDTPQLTRELLSRPEVTRRIAARAGSLTAYHVAERLLEDAQAGRFMLTPTWLMSAFGFFHSLYAPLFRWKQRRLLRGLKRQ